LLHLGHVANAIFVWGLAAQLGARVLLRIEDHDRQRSRSTYEQQLLDDLDWLGFVPDVYRTDAFRRGSCESRQSDRELLYRRRADDLIDRGLVYACTCTRQVAGAADKPAEQAGCPGGCRSRHVPICDGVAWRVSAGSGVEEFDDLLIGHQAQRLDRTDPVIRDRAGNWTYQFAVTVDDLQQEIDLVVRGQDLLGSTALQVRLARLFGRATPPAFAHHPLIMKSAQQKLSKSDGDTGIQHLRARGQAPADVIGLAAHQVGLSAVRRPIHSWEVASIIS
jgi:glutamyl-tRNA synthetase/glutamyl-Q tRNA(Asp) synthetase